MTTPFNTPSRLQRRKWWRVYVHKIQTKYATFVGILVLVYGFLVFYLAFLGPYSASDANFIQGTSLGNRLLIATQFLILGKTTWPAIICILIPAAVMFSFYLTHRLGGPLSRLEQSAREFQQGNLSRRIEVRKGDELEELTGMLNAALRNLDQAFWEIQDREAIERKVLRQCLDTMQTQSSVDQGLREQLELALKEGEQLDAVFKKFQLSKLR